MPSYLASSHVAPTPGRPAPAAAQPVLRKSQSKSSRHRRRRRRLFQRLLFLAVPLPPLLYLLLHGPPPSLVGYRSLPQCLSTFRPSPPGQPTNYHIPRPRSAAAPAQAAPTDDAPAPDGAVVFARADVYNYAAHLAKQRPDTWLIDVSLSGGGAVAAARLYTELPELSVAALATSQASVDQARRAFEATDRYPAREGQGAYFAEWDVHVGAFPEIGLGRVKGATVVVDGVLSVVQNPDRVVDSVVALMACGVEEVVFAELERAVGVGGNIAAERGNRTREWAMSELEAYLVSRGAPFAECRLSHATNLDRYRKRTPRVSTCLVSRDTSKRFPSIEQVEDHFAIDHEELDKFEAAREKEAEERRKKLAAEVAEAAARKSVNYWAAKFKRKPPGNATNYGIPKDYVDRPPSYFSDSLNGINGTDNVVLWQADVYNYAAHLAAETPGSWLVDVGGGSGFKAATIFNEAPQQKFVILDYGPNLNLSRANFAATPRFNGGAKNDVVFDSWNIDSAKFPEIGLERVRNATIVSADVIEHLSNPDKLVDGLLALLYGAGAKYVVLSTVDKLDGDELPGHAEHGPPPNPYHVREWTMSELEAYIKSRGAEHVVCELTHSTNLYKFKGYAKGTSACLVSRDPAKRFPALKQVRDFFPLDQKGYAEIEAANARRATGKMLKAAAEAKAKAEQLAAAAQKAVKDEEAKVKAVEKVKAKDNDGQNRKPEAASGGEPKVDAAPVGKPKAVVVANASVS